jgi:sterol desaturase/sphingolipid hydroxylase (fatty acid hydroxylase superfamily)
MHDAYFYWIHRIMHHARVFRHIHLVHHQSTNPSPWAAYSFHFAEGLAEGAVVIVLAFVLPMHVSTVIAFTFVSFVINVYGHLGYEIMPRRFRNSIWFQIINTSTYHNLHHRKFRGNYGLYLRVWDRWMGTEHPDYVKEYDKIQERRFGVIDPATGSGIEAPVNTRAPAAGGCHTS